MKREHLTQMLVWAARRTPLSRGQARKFTLGIFEKMHPEPFPGDFRGVPFLFHWDNTTERKALISDSYDSAELDFLSSFLSSAPATFIDIGANSGLYSLFLAAQMQPGSRVLAVEPNPSMCARIAANETLLRERGLAKGVEIAVETAAMGAQGGELYLDLSQGLGMAHLTESAGSNSIAVPVKTLASLCREKAIGQIDAMKIDVEGYEDRILLPFLSEAGADLLPRALVFETVHRGDWQQDAIEACRKAGYRTQAETRSSIMMTLPD